MPTIQEYAAEIAAGTKHKCDNCGFALITNDEGIIINHDPPVEQEGSHFVGDEYGLHTIHHLTERLDPSGIVPSGECPDCGCLAYLVTPNPDVQPILRPEEKQRVVISIRGGLVSCVYADDKAVEVLTVDWDNIEQGDHGANNEHLVPLDQMNAETLAEVVEEAITKTLVRIEPMFCDTNVCVHNTEMTREAIVYSDIVNGKFCPGCDFELVGAVDEEEK